MKKIVLCMFLGIIMALSGCSNCGDTAAPECTDPAGGAIDIGHDEFY
jgi:hypothetical protein